MLNSLQSTAQLTITTEADVTALVGRRERLQAQFRLTFTDLVVEAVAGALAAHPRLRMTAEGDVVEAHAEVHVGIAVALEEGLIVPVIRDADKKSLRRSRRRLASWPSARARAVWASTTFAAAPSPSPTSACTALMRSRRSSISRRSRSSVSAASYRNRRFTRAGLRCVG